MLIVCAMFRLGEPHPLRRPLGLSSPTVPLFSRADWGGRSASASSSVQFQVRRNRRPSRSTKLLRPMVDRSSATSWTQRKRSYVRQCMPFGLSGNSSDMLGLPPSRIRQKSRRFRTGGVALTSAIAADQPGALGLTPYASVCPAARRQPAARF